MTGPAPELPEPDINPGPDDDNGDGQAADEWNESDHPRDDNGKFGSSAGGATKNETHVKAENVANQFRERGHPVGVQHSINRNGDASSYLNVSGIGQLRISDHFSGSTTAWDVTGLSVDRIYELREEAAAAAEIKKAEAAKVVKRDADGFEKFKQAPNDKAARKAAIHEAHPNTMDDPKAYEAVLNRWRAKLPQKR